MLGCGFRNPKIENFEIARVTFKRVVRKPCTDGW